MTYAVAELFPQKLWHPDHSLLLLLLAADFYRYWWTFQSWEWVSFATLLCCNCVWNDTYPKWQINFKCVYGIMGNHKWCVICGLLPSQWSKCPQCASAALCVQQSGIITNHKLVHNMKFQNSPWTLSEHWRRKTLGKKPAYVVPS